MGTVLLEILKHNIRRERKALSRNACISLKGKRYCPEKEKIKDRQNIRPIFFHDTDKIIHSLAYSRYMDKTQVFSLFENDHITHRGLHVQFVSKIARTIGRALRLNEDLIEAIALGHDLGHAPFGHDGESILNDICKKEKEGFFNHNVQSVKLLMEIENRGNGLNLSLQVLDGVLAHNGEMLNKRYAPRGDKDWKKFLKEYQSCLKVDKFSEKLIPMTLEACVVRISDIIAYVGRDIEDAIKVKLINRKSIPKSIIKIIGSNNTEIINTLVMDLVTNSYSKKYLEFSEDVFKALGDLKSFNYTQIYKNPLIKTESDKIRKIFYALYEMYLKDLGENKLESDIHKSFLRGMGEEYRLNNSNKRIVIDYIAGMTDRYLINQFTKHSYPTSFGYSL